MDTTLRDEVYKLIKKGDLESIKKIDDLIYYEIELIKEDLKNNNSEEITEHTLFSDFAALWDQVEIYKYFKENKYFLSEEVLVYAIENDNLEFVQYLTHGSRQFGVAECYPHNCKNPMMDFAYDNLEILKFLNQKGYYITDYAMTMASKYGNYEVVKFLHKIQAPCVIDAIQWANYNRSKNPFLSKFWKITNFLKNHYFPDYEGYMDYEGECNKCHMRVNCGMKLDKGGLCEGCLKEDRDYKERKLFI